MRTKRLWVAAVCGAVMVAGLAGCGGGGSTTTKSNGLASKSPKVIVNDAITAADSAKSFKLDASGKLSSSAGPFQAGQFSMTGSFFKHPSRVAATIRGGTRSAAVRAIGGEAYINASRGFWGATGAPARYAAAFSGKWIKIPASQATGFESIFGIANFSRLRVGLGVAGLKKSETTVSGQKVVKLSNAKGFLYVAATGKPYPVEFMTFGKGTAKFSDWNAAPAVSVPPGAKSPRQLLGGGA